MTLHDGKPFFQKPLLGRPNFRKSLMSVDFLPATLGPEMAAPILWAPGIFWFYLQEKASTPIKFLVLGGGGILGSWVFLGGRGAPILFLWARGCSDN